MYRSCLYVPADRPDRFDRARTSGADAIIVDLEDAVTPTRRAGALGSVIDWLRRQRHDATTTDIWIRVNPGDGGLAEIAALAEERSIVGFCVAKTTSARHLSTIVGMLDGAQSDAVLAPLIEDAQSLLGAAAIASVRRVRRLQLGEADLSAQLGLDVSPDGTEMLTYRSQLVLVSAAAGLNPPLGPVATRWDDPEQLRRSTVVLRRLGYFGRACIHPAQLPVINEVFTPGPEELTKANRIVAAMERASVATDGGEFIDAAVARRASRILELGRRFSTPPQT